MGIYDRDYSQPGDYSSYGGGFGMSRLSPVVKYLLIINIALFLISVIGTAAARHSGPTATMLAIPAVLIDNWMPVDTESVAKMAQIWRLITYQFLHADFLHILFNMIGLFFLGPTLERQWGSKRFLTFYLMCGVAGGLFYMLLSSMGLLSPGIMIGASGAILGLLAACAILFPQFIVFILFFPVPIRIAAIILIVMYLINVVSNGQNAGGDAAHLAGMATGAVYVFAQPLMERLRMRRKSSLWEKRMSEYRDLQSEVDRILEKVHANGIQSLTRAEKKTLEEATRREQLRNKI